MSERRQGPSPYVRGLVTGAWYMAMLVLIVNGIVR